MLGATLAVPSVAFGGLDPIVVEAGDQSVFSPKVFTSNLNDSGPNFLWEWGDEGDNGETVGDHNVRQDRRLFRSGKPTDSVVGGYYLSASAGTFRYFCDVHGGPRGAGMSGKVKVPPMQYAITRLRGFQDFIPVQWATVNSETGNQYDVQYRVGDKPWRNWKTNTSKLQAKFGFNDNPVPLRNRVYSFRARSEVAGSKKRRSNFSPPLVVAP